MSSSKLYNATLTASITNAENVQSFPFIASSTFSIISFGNLMHLFVVGGIIGILNFFTNSPLHRFLYFNIIIFLYSKYALRLYYLIVIMLLNRILFFYSFNTILSFFMFICYKLKQIRKFIVSAFLIKKLINNFMLLILL